ncbi:MAG TPA: iron ABC transporter permease [Halobacteriales archaeon]|nr:iron ABC transporter permease [Halobacteriales archaeon]
MASGDGLGALAGFGDGGSRSERTPAGLTLVGALVAAAVLFPATWLVIRVVGIPIDRTVDLLTGTTMAEVLVNSVVLVVVVTVASALIGVPLAFLTARTDLPGRRVVTVIAALPLVVPSYIGAFAFVSAFGPRGEFADALAPLGVESIPSIYGLLGTALVLTLFTYPYVFLTTRAALLTFDARLVEAARTLNHSRWGAFRRVTLPQIAPGIAAGSLLVALYTLSDFGTPAIMGFDVFTRVIYVEYNAFGRDFAALLSLQLLAVTAVILAIESRLSRDASAYGGAGGRTGSRMRLGAWKAPALAIVGLIALLALVLPVGILVVWLQRGSPAFAGGGFAFSWVIGWHSVYVSVLAAAVATVAAVPVAYLAARYRSTLTTLIDRATYVGFAFPGLVLGLALVYFGSAYAPALYQTIPLLIFAYVVRFLPQSVGSIRSSVLQVDPRLGEAARTLGRTPMEAFRSVTLPLIAPGVVAGAALVFLTTMKELPATLLLRPTGFDTLVTYIWRVQDAGYYGQAAVPALALVAISGLSMLVIVGREPNDVE